MYKFDEYLIQIQQMEDNNLLKGYFGENDKFDRFSGKRQKKKLALMLKFLSEKFEKGRDYTEKEVNEILNQYHSFNDLATLRRMMFGSKLINRNIDGKSYWLTEILSK